MRNVNCITMYENISEISDARSLVTSSLLIASDNLATVKLALEALSPPLEVEFIEKKAEK